MANDDRDPFAVPVDQRDPARRFRGRLASGVTVWTTFDDDLQPVGITMSSVLVAEGDPPSIVGLVDPLSQFWTALVDSRRFVVHVLGRDHRRLADQLAGRYPGPDARFENVELATTEWGPAIAAIRNRAACSFSGFHELGSSLLVHGRMDSLDLDDLDRPLVYFRGGYYDAVPRH